MQTIKEVRRQRGLTQQEVASKANIAVGTLSALENGRYVRKGTLMLVCQALDISPDDTLAYNIRRIMHTDEKIQQ